MKKVVLPNSIIKTNDTKDKKKKNLTLQFSTRNFGRNWRKYKSSLSDFCFIGIFFLMLDDRPLGMVSVHQNWLTRFYTNLERVYFIINKSWIKVTIFHILCIKHVTYNDVIWIIIEYFLWFFGGYFWRRDFMKIIYCKYHINPKLGHFCPL